MEGTGQMFSNSASMTILGQETDDDHHLTIWPYVGLRDCIVMWLRLKISRFRQISAMMFFHLFCQWIKEVMNVMLTSFDLFLLILCKYTSMKVGSSLLGWLVRGYPMPTPNGVVEFQLIDKGWTLHPQHKCPNIKLVWHWSEETRNSKNKYIAQKVKFSLEYTMYLPYNYCSHKYLLTLWWHHEFM